MGLDEIIKIIIGLFVTALMGVFDFIAIYYSWLGHTVKTDFYITVVLAVILTILLLATFLRFIIDWIKKPSLPSPEKQPFP